MKAIIGKYYKEYKKAVEEKNRLGRRGQRYIIIRSPEGSVLVNKSQLSPDLPKVRY